MEEKTSNDVDATKDELIRKLQSALQAANAELARKFNSFDRIEFSDLELELKRKPGEADLKDRDDPSKFAKYEPALESNSNAAPVLPQIFQPEEYEFENRELELQQFIQLLPETWVAQVSRNTEKIQLALASQMVGSGKTWFGANILPSAQKNKAKLLPLVKGYTEQFDQFLKSKYIYINMEDVSPYNIEEFERRFFDKMKEQCPEVHIQQSNTDPREMKTLSPASTASYFHDHLKVPFLFHFDEIDTIVDKRFREKTMQLLMPNDEILNTYYMFWKTISPLYSYGTIYCSGRSPQLYYMGKQQDLRRKSPTLVKHFFFDRLLCSNIENMVQKLVDQKRLTLHHSVSVKELSMLVYIVTAGVPRIVTYTLTYLQKQGEITTELLDQEKFLSSAYATITEQQKALLDLSSWSKLEGEEFTLYTQFVYDAILGIPYKPENVKVTLGDTGLDALKIMWVLGIHTAKTPQYKMEGKADESLRQSSEIPADTKIYTIIPPLIAFALSQADRTEAIIFSAIIDKMNAKGFFTQKGELLEQVGRLCLQLRLATKRYHQQQSMTEVFPFLQGTFFENVPFTEFPQTFCFPKFVSSNGNWEKNEEIVKELLQTEYKLLKTKKHISQDIQILRSDWCHLVPILKPGQYAPASISFSGDYYIVYELPKKENDADVRFGMLVFQFKAGEKKYGPQELNEEIYKCFDLELLKKAQGKRVEQIALVFVGGEFNSLQLSVAEMNDYARKILPDKLYDDFLRIKESKKEKEKKEAKTKKKKDIPWPVQVWPEGLIVLQLTEEGKKQLLSPFNQSASK